MSQVNWDYKFKPPDIYEVDVIPLPDNGDVCPQCRVYHVVVEAAAEYEWGWEKYQRMCALCLYREYEITVKASKFDQENDEFKAAV